MSEELREHVYCGVGFQTRLEIPELLASDRLCPGCFTLTVDPDGQNNVSRWDHVWTDGNQVTLRAAETDGKQLLRFDDEVDFLIDPIARSIHCANRWSYTTRHLLLDQVLPRVLNDYYGFLMIHGSAIRTDHGAVVFIGDSGRGKSTLAGSFHEAGYELLTDDCMRLEIADLHMVTCTPTYRSLRLWPDSADELMGNAEYAAMSESSEKRRFTLPGNDQDNDDVPVAAILSLATPPADPDLALIQDIDDGAMLTELISQCFRLDLTSTDITRRIFEETASIVNTVRTGQLRYRRDHTQLPAVREVVLRWLAAV